MIKHCITLPDKKNTLYKRENSASLVFERRKKKDKNFLQ